MKGVIDAVKLSPYEPGIYGTSVVSWWYLNNTDTDTTHADLYQQL
jgi:hypothetical protein